MDLGALREALRPWMRINTWWQTDQPADDERLHRPLKAALEQLGSSISFEYSSNDRLFRRDHIQRFAVRAEHISRYLADVQSSISDHGVSPEKNGIFFTCAA